MTKRRQKQTKYFPIFIFISILFMSIGYALINSVILNLDGNLIAKNQSGIFITEAKLLSNNNADTSNSKFTNIYQTMLNSEITLSSTDPTSSITYQITVYNSNSIPYYFDNVTYDKELDTYSNEDIIFTLDNIQTGYKLNAKQSVTFNITYSYKNKKMSSSNNLISYLTFNFLPEPTVVGEYDYTGNSQLFTVPETGTYRIQLWGGSGYSSDGVHGRGGYVSGDIELTANTNLYIYVGGKGKQLSSTTQGTNDGGGYNGGGNASNDGHAANARFGGAGATDVRLVNAAWNNFDSLKSRILVAGGGGSRSEYEGGDAGGLIGYGDSITTSGSGGTQTSGGAIHTDASSYNPTGAVGGFGYGGAGGSYASGAGGGYYGGGGGTRSINDGGGGGGSSFISGHNGCNAIKETSTETSIVHTGQSVHYSGYKFNNTVMIDGAGYEWTNKKRNTSIGIPNFTGTGNLTTTYHNGYAKISKLTTTNKKGIYIQKIEYSSNVSADQSKSSLIKINDDEIQSNINLSTSDANSTITYKVTISNTDDISYYYNGLIYNEGIDTYSNTGITVSTENIALDEEIPSKSTKTIYITYSYKNATLAANSNLKALINISFLEAICPRDGRVCDLSGNNNHLNIVGATWDRYKGEIATDGVNDYLYIDMLDWNNTTEFTIEFYAKLQKSNGIFFESSLNSNGHYGSFYINTGEYGTWDITLAMKFSESSENKLVNHHNVDNFIDKDNYHHYVITLNTNNDPKDYIKMYKDGVYYDAVKINAAEGNITGLSLKNYPFYIASRAGASSFQKMNLKTLRIYTKELTLEEIQKNYLGENIIKTNMIAGFNFNS